MSGEMPLIGPESATFVWQGGEPPGIIGDFESWGGKPLRFRRAGDAWTAELKLPPDAYIEYSFIRRGERFLDPLNSRSIPNGIGRVNNFFAMDEWLPSATTRRRNRVARGSLTRHRISDPFRLVGGFRDVWLYEPAGDKGETRLLVVLDGQDYLKRGRILAVLDNLIAAETICPLTVLLVRSHATARAIEYACGAGMAEFLADTAVPFVRDTAGTVITGTAGILGDSIGGLMALYAAVAHPDVFGAVLSQSGAFTDRFGFGPLRHIVTCEPAGPIRVWMDVGKYEFLLDGNRRTRDLLVEKGYDVTYREFPGGHNYTCWRNELHLGLEAIFGVS